MRVLIDTNIVIHRETNRPQKSEIGELFRWLDNLHYEKCVHPGTLAEFQKLSDPDSREAMRIKLENYNHLRTVAPLQEEVQSIADEFDNTENDVVDTQLINEVFAGRVDGLITEDRKIHRKARALGIAHLVYTISDFLEKVVSENPDLADYSVPSVSKEYFGNIDVNGEFFDSFRDDYDGFDGWFARKSDEIAYISRSDSEIVAFLYIKTEGEDEPYSNIEPTFSPAKRLKIGTLKVEMNGYKIGERFIKIIFDNALRFRVDEIYTTVFSHQGLLISLLEDYGFRLHGVKRTASGEEQVFTRSLYGEVTSDTPRLTYPFISRRAGKFIVPIYEEYHTSLFPDSILKTESPMDFEEHEPFRNAIAKVYVSRSWEKGLKSGDAIVFYRTGGYYRGVATTLGIVEDVITDISSFEEFRQICGKRSVFSDEELLQQWEYKPTRPFVVNFLYAYSFPRRPNLAKLIELGVIQDIHSVPRGFTSLSEEEFSSVIRAAECDEGIIVD